jgi:phosphoribosylformylglycinamidine synthase
LGVEVHIDLKESRNIFDESQSRAVIEVKPENTEAVMQMATELGLAVSEIGTVGGEKIQVNGIGMDLEKLKSIYYGTFAEVIEQDL